MGRADHAAGVPPMTERQPEITTHRKGATIGVNRDGKPIGVVTDLGHRRFAMTLYTAECPWDARWRGHLRS
jgi:hypothetical protein